MPEPFKNYFNPSIIAGMGDHFLKAWADFDRDGFVQTATENLAILELKARSEQITQALCVYLPDDFPHAGEIILSSLSPEDGSDLPNTPVNEHGISGWAVMPIADYVGLRGLGCFSLSMTLLKEMTSRFSSEFGIRFFLIKKPEETLQTLMGWAEHENEHVRRLSSEGSRPRLPWAMRLPIFVKDPRPLLPLLEKLKDDPSEYVRRSVANHLNDIAKDHPELVAEIAQQWFPGASPQRQKLVRHACRTLIKQGDQKILQVLGYEKPVLDCQLKVLTPKVLFGTFLRFEIVLTSTKNKAQALIIDYVIHHQKANGLTSPKVFKWKTITLKADQLHYAEKKHAMKKITTRVYYPGLHRLEIAINGLKLDSGEFELLK